MDTPTPKKTPYPPGLALPIDATNWKWESQEPRTTRDGSLSPRSKHWQDLRSSVRTHAGNQPTPNRQTGTTAKNLFPIAPAPSAPPIVQKTDLLGPGLSELNPSGRVNVPTSPRLPRRLLPPVPSTLSPPTTMSDTIEDWNTYFYDNLLTEQPNLLSTGSGDQQELESPEPSVTPMQWTMSTGPATPSGGTGTLNNLLSVSMTSDPKTGRFSISYTY